MNLSNVKGLPEAVIRALRNDSYDRGNSDYTVTQLIDSGQRQALRKKFGSALVEDASDRVYSLLGQAVHAILERAEVERGGMAEKRLFAEVDGSTISGQFDRCDLHDGVLDDYKVCSVWSAGGKVEWEQQLNILRWLAIYNEYKVDRLRIIAIFRDWSKSHIDRKADYPQAPIGVIDVPVWDLSETYEFIRERVALHRRADAGSWDPCTDQERWYSGTKWAVMKPGGRRAIRVYDSRDEIRDLPDKAYVEERPGTPRRCLDYCEVSQFCPQFQAWRESASPEREVGDDPSV